MTNNTKKCYLDSNILVGLKHQNSIFHKKSKNLLKKLIRNSFKLYISPLVLDEFLFQVKIILGRQNNNRLLKKYLKEILKLPSLYVVNPPRTKEKQILALNFMKEFNLRPRDAYHLLTAKENKINYLLTFDKDFKKVFQKGTVKKFKA